MAPTKPKLLINIQASDLVKEDVIPFMGKKPKMEIKKETIHDIVSWSSNPLSLMLENCPEEYRDKLKQVLPKNVKHRTFQSDAVNDIYYELGFIFTKWKETRGSLVICKRYHHNDSVVKACKKAMKAIQEKYDECVKKALAAKMKAIHSGLETVPDGERFRPIGLDCYPKNIPHDCFKCGHNLMEGIHSNLLAEQTNNAAMEQYNTKLRLYNDREQTGGVWIDVYDRNKKKTVPPPNPTIQNGQLEPFIYHCVCYKAYNYGPGSVNCPMCEEKMKDDGVEWNPDDCPICNCNCNIAVRSDTVQELNNILTLKMRQNKGIDPSDSNCKAAEATAALDKKEDDDEVE